MKIIRDVIRKNDTKRYVPSDKQLKTSYRIVFPIFRVNFGLFLLIVFHVLGIAGDVDGRGVGVVIASQKNVTTKYAYDKDDDNSENRPEDDTRENVLQNRLQRDSYDDDENFNGQKTTAATINVKRYKIADIEFQRVETPMLIAIWIFCASLAKICFHMAPNLNQKVPESCLLIVVGVVIGLVLVCIKNLHVTALTPDTFFIYMLPPIILDAGYFMPNRLFFDNLGTILMFAVVGTIFNTLTIGGSLWLVNTMGLFGEMPVLELFLFAALISAVDPVAVLAVFEEIHVNEILYIVVFGESLLNDAVTVVLYHMFEAFNEMGPSNILFSDIMASVASFFVVAIGGTFVGIMWGFLTGFVTRFTHQTRVIEPVLILVMAYISYLNAEMFHVSGILAITFCGITMKNYVEANISHKSHTTAKYTMKMLSSSSETIIFMFLGVSTVSEHHQWNTSFVVITIVFCTVYRFVGVMFLSAILNHFRLYKLNTVDKFVMSYGGLRGAVAFALALLINPESVKRREMFVTTTIAVIYFTVFIQGITIRPLVKILNVKTAEKRKPTMNERIHERFMDHMMAGIEDILGHHGNHHLRDRFKRFDNKFIRPYLLKNHQGAEPKILETYSKLAMKDALDFMRRNASTLGNISNAGSVSAIFRNYTATNLQGSSSFSQLDSSAWNVDMQELEYNPSKKDITDAKIHHLLTAELRQSTAKSSVDVAQHRRLSYSRHVVNEKELSSQSHRRLNLSMRRTISGDVRRHHHRRSRRSTKDGKLNHVTFPLSRENSDAKRSTNEQSAGDEWDGGITFTVNPTNVDETELENLKQTMFSLETSRLDETANNKRITEVHWPWQRLGCEEIEDTSTFEGQKLPSYRNEDDSNIETEICRSRKPSQWSSNIEYIFTSPPPSTSTNKKNSDKAKLATVLNIFRKDRSRCDIIRLESQDSTDQTSSVGQKRSGKVSVKYLSPYRHSYTPMRRGSMMELSSTTDKTVDNYFLLGTEDDTETNPRIRSSSVCIPRKRNGIFKLSSKSSSSSSSDSNDDESYG